MFHDPDDYDPDDLAELITLEARDEALDMLGDSDLLDER